jgi:hypothetical protein
MFFEEEQANRRYTDLELLEEKRDIVAFWVEKHQQAPRKYHSQCVRGRALSIGDLVHKWDQRTKVKTKLTPPWQGPYIVVDIARPSAYRLAEVDGDMLSNTWNMDQLQRFYA